VGWQVATFKIPCFILHVFRSQKDRRFLSNLIDKFFTILDGIPVKGTHMCINNCVAFYYYRPLREIYYPTHYKTLTLLGKNKALIVWLLLTICISCINFDILILTGPENSWNLFCVIRKSEQTSCSVLWKIFGVHYWHWGGCGCVVCGDIIWHHRLNYLPEDSSIHYWITVTLWYVICIMCVQVYVPLWCYVNNFCHFSWQVKCKMSNLAQREPEGHLFNQVSQGDC